MSKLLAAFNSVVEAKHRRIFQLTRSTPGRGREDLATRPPLVPVHSTIAKA